MREKTQETPRPTTQTAPVLLYDGACGFCQATVGFILQHERRHDLRFAPRQGAFGTAVLARHPELHGVDSVVWLEPNGEGGSERTLVGADAAMEVMVYLGGWWRCMQIARLIHDPGATRPTTSSRAIAGGFPRPPPGPGRLPSAYSIDRGGSME